MSSIRNKGTITLEFKEFNQKSRPKAEGEYICITADGGISKLLGGVLNVIIKLMNITLFGKCFTTKAGISVGLNT